ncbi:SDR family oxidoreductase [Limosilactobacillus allomucosae]|uniref:SDR family oxidoreductase n=1 Tax=Limosilactobacillus allomucosae TaxID=3142938 RepID=A0AAU7C577_9LACO
MSVKDKVIIITGASSGIGLATAELLAKDGAKLTLAARHVDKLAEFEKYGDQVLVKQTDVAEADQVQELVDQTVAKFGRVDVIFNNAGIMPVSYLSERRINDWQQIMQTNVMGVLNGIAAVLPYMEEQNSGHIITTGSTAAYKVFPKFAVYSASKFAVRALMEGLRFEEREHNIKSTLISPGTTVTNLVNTIPGEADREDERRVQQSASLTAEEVAEVVKQVIDTPDNLAVSEIHVRPVKQLA